MAVGIELVVGILFLIGGASANCTKYCVSDAQCKGFTSVSDLRYCINGCCTSYNTALAETFITAQCIGDFEGFTNSLADSYPWVAQFVNAREDDVCVVCMGALIAPGWVATDDNCYNKVFYSTYLTTVFFYLDNASKRQVYKAIGYSVADATRNMDMDFIQIEYIGSGTPLPIDPAPINCLDTYPSEFTLLYWLPVAGAPLGTRTFSERTVSLMPQADCIYAIQTNTLSWSVLYDYYYCLGNPDDIAFFMSYNFLGNAAISVDGSGNVLFLGQTAYYYLHVPMNVNATVVTKTSMRAAALESYFNATCAN